MSEVLKHGKLDEGQTDQNGSSCAYIACVCGNRFYALLGDTPALAAGNVQREFALHMMKREAESDPVDHPKHYNSHPSGIEAIEICEHHNFNVGNAIKYLWRAGLKGDALEDLKKSRWYLDREIERLSK